MAYSQEQYDTRTMSYGHQPKMRFILLSEATEDEIGEYYKRYSELKQEFEDTRPCFYAKYGTFHNNPLYAHYGYFLKKKGIKYIALEVL